MKRWNLQKKKNIENKKVDEFLDEILAVFKKHNMSLAHEDAEGSFMVENYNSENIDWISTAIDNTSTKTETKEK